MRCPPIIGVLYCAFTQPFSGHCASMQLRHRACSSAPRPPTSSPRPTFAEQGPCQLVRHDRPAHLRPWGWEVYALIQISLVAVVAGAPSPGASIAAIADNR
jgi:hypothetical protein